MARSATRRRDHISHVGCNFSHFTGPMAAQTEHVGDSGRQATVGRYVQALLYGILDPKVH